MDLYPAIDLLDGRAVRLFQGDYSQMTVYSDSPAQVAAQFRDAGAKYLHLVDLDGAKMGKTPNFETIARIVGESGLLVEVGGGIRDMETAARYLDAGVMRVIIGTAAVTAPKFLRRALEKYGDKIAVGVDLRDGLAATHGWTQTSGKSGLELCEELEKLGVKTFICTDISKDGALQGPNVELYRRLKTRLSAAVIASGGVSVLDDLLALRDAGADGAILGKSLYTGSIDLKTALEIVGVRDK